jgi:hypothetical protein
VHQAEQIILSTRGERIIVVLSFFFRIHDEFGASLPYTPVLCTQNLPRWLLLSLRFLSISFGFQQLFRAFATDIHQKTSKVIKRG